MNVTKHAVHSDYRSQTCWQVAWQLQLHCLCRLNPFIPCVCTFTHLSLLIVFAADNEYPIIRSFCSVEWVVNHAREQVNILEYKEHFRFQEPGCDKHRVNDTYIPTIILCVGAIVIINVGLAQAPLSTTAVCIAASHCSVEVILIAEVTKAVHYILPAPWSSLLQLSMQTPSSLGSIYTTMLLMNTVTLVFVFTKEVQRLHKVIFSSFYQRKLIMPVECGRVVFWKHSKFSTMHFRKRNFVLIDVEVGLLLTFLASMKAKVRLYQKYVSIFGCLHVKRYRFSSIHFQGLHLGLRFQKSPFSLCVFIVLV